MNPLSAVAASVLAVSVAAQAQNSIFLVENTPNLPGDNFLAAIAGDAENDLWAVGSLSLHFDGSTWTAIPLAATNQMNGVAVLSASDV